MLKGTNLPEVDIDGVWALVDDTIRLRYFVVVLVGGFDLELVCPLGKILKMYFYDSYCLIFTTYKCNVFVWLNPYFRQVFFYTRFRSNLYIRVRRHKEQIFIFIL